MADFCALCGEKVSVFSRKTLVCANEDQFFCNSCNNILYPMDNRERGVYLLEHGKPERADKMRSCLAWMEAREAERNAYEPEQRPCPACGGTMDRKLKDFRIGADGGGGLVTLLAEQYSVDLYACSECGKVEMYTAGFAAKKAREAALQKANEQTEAAPVSAPKRPKNEKKPPWEK